MAGRVSAFADVAVIEMATKEFVAVCADDWYQRRRKDAEGAFFQKIVGQTVRKLPVDGTKQGIYVFTADGEVLSFKNAGNDADVTRAELKRALAAFARLPAAKRAPGVVRVAEHGPLDARFTRTPPKGGLVVKVNARILDEAKPDALAELTPQFAKGTCSFVGGAMAGRDTLWLDAKDVAELAPAKAEVGFRYELPAVLAGRILRFHLVDFTRGEPPFWKPEEVRRRNLVVSVTAVTPDAIELRLDGEALLCTDADPAKAERGYEVKLLGKLRYQRAAKTFDRFDIAAKGEHWGEGDLTKGARPGRSLLGISFGPVAGEVPADRVPPQAARDLAEYWARE